ncbi:MAG TPA: pyridoxine 5'-phosphate synthase [Flavobacteriales bacterium]|jgi:pyridoxine 5-phosphate synthase|nr:pyridoxine 5'-phosphate synthase [Flavobacteriales bacterium]
MTRLSVNINKVATIRNARGGDIPNVVEFAKTCEESGAQGITVHPRPDERHIRFNDVYELAERVETEFNIEGYPSRGFMKMVLDVKPHQVTLVPDPPDVLTSNAGWDTKKNFDFLLGVIDTLKSAGIRTSIFMETDLKLIEYAAKIGTERIELYTESYAKGFPVAPKKTVAPFVRAAKTAHELGMEVNAGHDLSLENLKFFKEHVQPLAEVSIGHALISDALYYGITNTIQLYLRALQK